jgi:hypothetical protein
VCRKTRIELQQKPQLIGVGNTVLRLNETAIMNVSTRSVKRRRVITLTSVLKNVGFTPT